MTPTLLLAVVGLLNLISVGDAGGGFLLPLLPLATITGHGGLYASSLAGSALMKLKAATAIAALAGITESGFHFKIGHGWTPDLSNHHPHKPQHHGGGGWGWHRRRRSIEGDSQVYDPSYDQVLSQDQLGCGMRLVCELASLPVGEVPEDGKIILELFGRDGKAPNAAKSSKGRLTYSYASLLGENAKDASACSRVYSGCPYGFREILEGLRAAGV